MQVLFRYHVDSRQGGQAPGQNDTEGERGIAKVERGLDNQKRPEIRLHPKEVYQECISRRLYNLLR